MPTRRTLIAGLVAAAPLGLALALAPDARADDISAARATIQSTGNQMIAIINSPGGPAQKQAAFQQLVYANVDVDGVARFVLGRFWRVATPEQQQSYMQTFRQLLVYAVTGQTSTFQSASFTLGDATQQSLRDIWNSPAYRDFRTTLLSDAPPKPCQNCGMRWSL